MVFIVANVAKTSPDAYVQIAMQLTWYRLYQKVTPIYESASTRLFRDGRTETVRSMSTASLDFCKSFDDDNVLYATKRELYQKAINSQSGYMKAASIGKGIDRHMLGLRSMIKEGEMEKATMFTDPSFVESMYFRLSTSNMSPGTLYYGGFGPVVPEGYGINYAISESNVKFSISSKRSAPETSSFKFRERLEQTLIDMFILFPKRSEIWGPGWDRRFAEEAKEEHQIGQMKKLSEERLKKMDSMGKRYNSEE